jgi:hypothetical protein
MSRSGPSKPAGTKADFASEPFRVPTDTADERAARARRAVAPTGSARGPKAFPSGGHEVPLARQACGTPDIAINRLALPRSRKRRRDRSAIAVSKQDRHRLGITLTVGKHRQPNIRAHRAGHALTTYRDRFRADRSSGQAAGHYHTVTVKDELLPPVTDQQLARWIILESKPHISLAVTHDSNNRAAHVHLGQHSAHLAWHQLQ